MTPQQPADGTVLTLKSMEVSGGEQLMKVLAYTRCSTEEKS